MAKLVRREEPCSRCGGEVVEVYKQPTRLGRARLVGAQHAEGDTPGNRVDDQCTRGQHGPTADYGEG